MKPKAITGAVWLLGISFGFNLLTQAYLLFTIGQARGLFNDDETRAMVGAVFFVRFILALFVPLIAVLIFSKRRAWLSYVFLIFCCFHALKIPVRVSTEFQTGLFFGTEYLLFLAMQFAGTALLFVKSSRDWLNQPTKSV